MGILKNMGDTGGCSSRYKYSIEIVEIMTY
jgi:hypothetical protein